MVLVVLALVEQAVQVVVREWLLRLILFPTRVLEVAVAATTAVEYPIEVEMVQRAS